MLNNREVLARLDDLENRLDELPGAHAKAPTLPDPRANECSNPMRSDGYHQWRILSSQGEPIGRRCATCDAEQLGTMMWNTALHEELSE